MKGANHANEKHAISRKKSLLVGRSAAMVHSSTSISTCHHYKRYMAREIQSMVVSWFGLILIQSEKEKK